MNCGISVRVQAVEGLANVCMPRRHCGCCFQQRCALPQPLLASTNKTHAVHPVVQAKAEATPKAAEEPAAEPVIPIVAADVSAAIAEPAAEPAAAAEPAPAEPAPVAEAQPAAEEVSGSQADWEQHRSGAACGAACILPLARWISARKTRLLHLALNPGQSARLLAASNPCVRFTLLAP